MKDPTGDNQSTQMRTDGVTPIDGLSELLAMAADHAQVGVVITDEVWDIVHASHGFLTMVGVEADEIVGENILAILDSSLERTWISEAVTSLETTGQWQGRLRETTRWGLSLTLDVSATQFFGQDDRFLGNTIVFFDVSREEELERQLRLAQRLDSMGQLAGGIAHNFNNLLQTMENSAHLLLGAISGNEGATRHLRLIRNTLKDGRQLVRQLLALGRQETMEPEPVRLGDLVMELVPMLRRTIPEFIDLELDVPRGSDDPVVEVDTSAIQQVLLNLAINARDAMPQGGTITIRVGSGHSSNHAALTVEDTGTGIPFEHLERIFEPFYTTKGQQGSGLGLATVEGIVAQCGGSISVETSPGQGTTFTVELPRTRDVEPKTAAEVIRQVDGDTTTPSTRGRLLLVEDDAGVRESLAEILDAYGFEIRTATSGGEALAVLDDNPAWQPEFLITDLMMPGISGQELARLMCARLPDLRVVLASGYHPDSLPDLGHVTFLRKPFRIPLLLETIDELHAGDDTGTGGQATHPKEDPR
jgi:PAS domain S-box-containing protein